MNNREVKNRFIGLKLSMSEMRILDRLRDGKTISYTIRQLIREKATTGK